MNFKNLFYKKWRLLIDTAILVGVILLIKVFIIEQLSLEFFNVSPLFTSIIAGGVFVISILLAGVISDYKESEKLPSEISASIEAIYEDGLYVKRLKQDFNLPSLRQKLQEIIVAMKKDLSTPHARSALKPVSALSDSFLEMEALGIPANHIVRLKQEQSVIRKNLLRMYYIQRTQFVPSAYILMKTFVVLVVVLLIFTKIEPALDSIILVAFVSYLFIYLIKLIHTIDTPFRVDEYTMDDVSLFLLREAHERMNEKGSKS